MASTKQYHTLEITDDTDTKKVWCTLEIQVKYLEKEFVRISSDLAKITRKHELLYGIPDDKGGLLVRGEASIEGGHYRMADAKKQAARIESLKVEQKKLLEQLETVYPLANKKMSDLPISEIGIEPSDIEIDHYDTYEQRTKDIVKVSKIKSIVKKEFDPESLDQGDDESEDEYFERRAKIAKRDNPIVDVKTTKINNAWISPKGQMYNVENQPFPMHLNASSDYVYMGIVPKEHDGERWLEKNGWMKLTSNSFYLDGELTQDQIDFLSDYMFAHNTDVIDWIGQEKTLNEILETH